MANMSYCRFENTANDLADCVEAINNGELRDLSTYEIQGLVRLIALCKEVASDDIKMDSAVQTARYYMGN